MADSPPAQDGPSASNSKPAGYKPAGNPAFRMMGLPNFKFKLPSRNWLIFWTITGSFTTAILYDRYHKKRAQQKWCNFVSHIAEEPLPNAKMPRRITIFLAAPPGDGLRAAREHFHEYVKPILVAGALDWDVIEGRKEGEVRAGLAEKIRRLRRRRGERPPIDSTNEDQQDESQEQLLYEVRQRAGITEWDGAQGDLVLGRHTWKEYIRGLHEGWLGPLSQPESPIKSSEAGTSTEPKTESYPALEKSQDGDQRPDGDSRPEQSSAPETPPAKKTKSEPIPPYISPADYSSLSTSSVLDTTMDPSLPLPLPHRLGFFNTPIRLYRFLNRRRLADSTGRSVAALVLASHSREYNQSAEYAPAMDPDVSSPSVSIAEVESGSATKGAWEQEAVLQHEEQDWHKSAWKPNAEGGERERVWQEPMAVDDRIARRMRIFELADGEDEKAEQLAAQKRREEEGVFSKTSGWLGWTEKEKKGWDMGLEGDESS
ncbi:mitochondrial import inner membrane translocase subunit tim54 [Lecanora helva]